MRDKSIKLIITFLVLLFLSSIFNFSPINIGKNENFQITIKENKPRTSKFWDLTGTPISIDDSDPSKNWAYTASHYDWCSGSGSWTDPYIIENVTVNDNYLGSSIEISNSFAYFIIKNCTFLHSSNSIKLINVNNSKIIGNNCSFNDHSGMSLEHCNNITILQNIMNNNIQSGIVLWSGNNNSIIENKLDFNGYSAMNLYWGKDNNISRNLMTVSGIRLCGSYSLYKIDSTNKLNGKPIYYFTDEVGLNSHNFTNAGQIILVNCKSSTISHLNLSNGSVGMSLYYCDNNTIEYNEFSNNIQSGLFLEECNNNTIINNVANNNEEGIMIMYGNYNEILNNSAMWNNVRGIYVFYNEHTLIENNTLNFNNRGLYIGQCEKCFVKNNTLISNIYYGLYCYNGINNNISNNYITGNQEYGIYFSNDKNYNVSSNTLIGCGFYLQGDMDALTSHDIKSTNTVNGKPLYYYVNSEYLNPIDFFNAGQVILINCNNSLIANQTISNASKGISCLYCINITILNNTISYNNKEGVYFNECTNITICNNTVINNLNGLSINDSNNSNVSENHFLLNNDKGIYLSDCLENLIINNSINNNKMGIAMVNIVNSTIIDNRFENNIWAISLTSCLNVTLRNNKMYNCGLDVNAPLERLTTYNIDTSNKVNEKILYYYTNKTNLGESDFVNAGQIFLINCNNSLISNINLKNCSIGIGLYYSSNNTVLNTNSSYNWVAGIVLFFSNNNSISGNLARYCKNSGILLLGSNNNSITENLVENNGGEGIYGALGLAFNSNNNQIRKNYIKDNTKGLILKYVSSNNTVSENIFLNNLEQGASIGDINSEQNIFYNNTFIGNLINAEDNGTNNMWDNGIIGNYWDDYSGVDINDNGIGDTPYQIQGEAGSVDNLPIWDDGLEIPVVTIHTPSSQSVYGNTAPTFELSIEGQNIDEIWYTLDNGITNITCGTYGQINQTEWDNLSDGTYIIRFYANNTAGTIGFTSVTVGRDTTAPEITITSPGDNQEFSATAPTFDLLIVEGNLDTIWYTLDNGVTNITCGISGQINQTIWDSLSVDIYTITFYANDTAGNIAFSDVKIKKVSPTTSGIPGYDLLFLLGIISTVAVIIIKKRLNHLE